MNTRKFFKILLKSAIHKKNKNPQSTKKNKNPQSRLICFIFWRIFVRIGSDKNIRRIANPSYNSPIMKSLSLLCCRSVYDVVMIQKIILLNTSPQLDQSNIQYQIIIQLITFYDYVWRQGCRSTSVLLVLSICHCDFFLNTRQVVAF